MKDWGVVDWKKRSVEDTRRHEEDLDEDRVEVEFHGLRRCVVTESLWVSLETSPMRYLSIIQFPSCRTLPLNVGKEVLDVIRAGLLLRYYSRWGVPNRCYFLFCLLHKDTGKRSLVRLLLSPHYLELLLLYSDSFWFTGQPGGKPRNSPSFGTSRVCRV